MVHSDWLEIKDDNYLHLERRERFSDAHGPLKVLDFTLRRSERAQPYRHMLLEMIYR